MPTTEKRSTADQLRRDIDRGRTGDKVAWPDPASAPLGTDEEAAGTRLAPQDVETASATKLSFTKIPGSMSWRIAAAASADQASNSTILTPRHRATRSGCRYANGRNIAAQSATTMAKLSQGSGRSRKR